MIKLDQLQQTWNELPTPLQLVAAGALVFAGVVAVPAAIWTVRSLLASMLLGLVDVIEACERFGQRVNAWGSRTKVRVTGFLKF